MADVDSSLYQWSTTESSNKPTGATTIGTGLDDNLRQIQATIRAWLANKGADIASATTTDLGAVAGLAHDITGTTTITSFGTVDAGIWKIVKFEGALTLTHNATSLILPGAENITTANGDIAIFISEGSGNWRCVTYFPVAINPAKLVSTDETQELDNKTLDSSVGKGTWTASGTWTLPALTLGGAITYGGVTLSNAVTGTGNMGLSAAPTMTGTVKAGDAGARTTGAFATDLASSAGIEYDTDTAVFRGWGANAGTVAKAKLRLSASDGSGTVYPWRADGSGNFYTGGSDGTTPSSTSAGIMAGVSNQLYTSVGNTSASSIMHRFINANGLVGSITTSGSGTSFDTSSDKDLKIDDGIATSVEVLKNTQVHLFRWKSDNEPDVGVFAQDAYLVKPKAVRVGSDEVDENGRKTMPWAVDYSKYVPDLIVGWKKHDALLSILLEEITADHQDIAALRVAVATRIAAIK